MDTYIIAEIGINHNRSRENAHKLIDAAADAGCSAAKLQLFQAEELYPQSAGELDWKNPDGSKYSYDIFSAVKKFETPFDWIDPLLSHCQDRNIDLLASVFDAESLFIALRYSLPRIKIASSLVKHLPLLRQAAQSGIPLLMSTGGAKLGEIESAVDIILAVNSGLPSQEALTLLHCNLQYPTPLENCNLGTLRTFAHAFPEISIGYSDHTADPEAAPAEAVRLGASVIEKHVTLDRNMPGPDHFFALEPEQLKRMVEAIRAAEQERKYGQFQEPNSVLYGSSRLHCARGERYLRDFVYPVLITRNEIAAGSRICPTDLRLLRPAKKERGLEADMLPVLAAYMVCASQTIPAETPLSWDCAFPRNPERKTILLRADAHAAVGTGDLASFIHLGEWLAARGWDWHICTRATVEAKNIVTSRNLNSVHWISPDLSVGREVCLTASLARQLDAKAVLVQVTDRPLHEYAKMDFPGLKGCVSFEEKCPHGFDLVWSWDVTVSSGYRMESASETKFFLGPEYVVLPQEFSPHACKSLPGKPEVRKLLLVVMGGGDPLNLTYDVVKKLTTLSCLLHVRIILGAGYRFEPMLRELLETADFSWEIKRHVADMLPEYLSCDVCISAGGLTASELVFLGKPALLIAALGHQDSRCALFAKLGWAKFLGRREAWDMSLDDILSFTPTTETPFVHKLNAVLDYLDSAVKKTDGSL